ncbi:Suppressor of glycerol defect protein 1 [Pichia kudriavzevii]|uniref:Suppressor of glycerol defect protein 1 n=1 Tax=Pichia kudriavzevii TaxID=4909 RepID=A0A1V2LPJ2_PICKU|nr:Suppressor of glycerol defect protein 1 [Pichia kudriavzevii]
MSKKRHAINIPGVMLDSIRDSEEIYENDARFKRQKIKGPSVIHRKENRRQSRMEKKQSKKQLANEHMKLYKEKQKEYQLQKKKSFNKKPSLKQLSARKDGAVDSNKCSQKKKKRVSFSNNDDICEIPARESNSENEIDVDFEKWEKEFGDESDDSEQFYSNSENDSEDENEEEETSNLIATLKQLKKVQRGAHTSDGYGSDDVTAASGNNVTHDICNELEYSENKANLDEEQQRVMNQLAVLKGKKKSGNINVRIVKEDELEDDTFESSDDDDDDDDDDNDEGFSDNSLKESDDDQKSIMTHLAKSKSRKNKELPGATNTYHGADVRFDKYDGSSDKSIDSDFKSDSEFYEAEEEVMAKLRATKGKRIQSDQNLRIIKEDELSDADSTSQDEEEKLDPVLDDLDDEQKHVMAKLALLKGKVNSNSGIRIVKEDELSDDSETSNESDIVRQSGSEVDPSSGKDTDEDREEEEIMKKLAAIKGNKRAPMKLKIVKEDELSDDSTSDIGYSSDERENEEIDYAEPQFRSKNDEELDYYTQKLKLDKNTRMKRESEDDFVGGLFEGLDFMEKYDNADNIDYEPKQKKSEVKEKKTKKENSPKPKDQKHQRIISAHDREMIQKEKDDMMFYAKKLGINPKKGVSKQGDDDFIGGLFDGLDLNFSDETETGDDEDLSEGKEHPKAKENPYMAPVDPSTLGLDNPSGSRYIPPALRKKLAMNENTEDSEVMKRLLRLVKGPFNKLSESNFSSSISELNEVYIDNPRQFVNEAVLKVVIQSVCISTPMLESFLVLYSSAIVALYKLQGVEFGAFVIQKLVEDFLKEIESTERAKQELINLSGMIGYLYTLNLISATLIYDIIKWKLIVNPTELKTDILLKLIRSCGSKLRTDDSTALNAIITELTKSVKLNESRGVKISTRTRFLIDTITDLKNNRLRNMENVNTVSMINRLKKQLGSISNSRNLDAIKVNLEDIENIEERGKWWLVGSAWKGNEGSRTEVTEKSDVGNVNEDFLKDEDELTGEGDVNWMELARQCRMNTDVRRAIFISIMSAEDFKDAFMKLEKLSLKKSQKGEIPNILMHCATLESNNNPYYSYLGKKLCDDHGMRRAFQLNLWDFIKELDGEESSTTILHNANEEERLWKILNMGRFFGFLLGEGSLSLNVLRVVNFLTASSDVKIFLEIMLITVLDIIAKKSQVDQFGSGKSKRNVTYTGKLVAERIAKCDEQPLLLKGLQYFLNDKLRDSNFIKGKKQQARIDWGIDTLSAMIGEMLKSQK